MNRHGAPANLSISKRHYQDMLAQLRQEYPMEACGLLAGSSGRISRRYSILNSLQSPTEFEMEPLQQLEAMLDMEVHGLDLLAIYHSHPHGPEIPSETDVAKANYPETVQIIVSFRHLTEPKVRAFTIQDGQVDEVRLIIE